VVENLILSGIEDHTFGPMNLREHFPEEELTLGKNRFLNFWISTVRLVHGNPMGNVSDVS